MIRPGGSTVDQRFILEDFFAKLARFTKSKVVP
jgi:hypothetical protein